MSRTRADFNSDPLCAIIELFVVTFSVDPLRSLVASLRALAPDFEMESLRAAAVQWIEDRVETSWELARSAVEARARRLDAAKIAEIEEGVQRAFYAIQSDLEYPRPRSRWSLALDGPARPSPNAPQHERPSVHLSRSMPAVFDRWSSRAQMDATFDPVTMVRAKLAQAYASRDHLAAMLIALCADTDALRGKIEGGSLYVHAALECVIDHWLWAVFFDEPSPLGPWIELWQRGAWPCWVDAEAHVFIPIRGDDGVAMIDEGRRATAPRFAGESPLPLSHVAPCAQDVALGVTDDGVRRACLRLQDRGTLVGRAADADIGLRDPSVNRRHLLLRRVDGRWCAEDLASTNGTVLRQRYIRERVLLVGGELLSLGECSILFLGSAV